jgi:transposase
MRVKVTQSKNATSFYIIKSVRIKGKNTSKIVEKLGTLKEVQRKAGNQEPMAWAKQRAAVLTQEEKEEKAAVTVNFSPAALMEANKQVKYNAGYLFLQKLYYDLQLDKHCAKITEKYNFDFDLNAILSNLIYSRILFPHSKKESFAEMKNFVEPPQFQLHQIYRTLEVLAKENDGIQSTLYKQSEKLRAKDSKILYYDCTNFFFEIEAEDAFRKYGHSKENRPNPIVQFGLFMDGDGIPLAFDMSPGNTNEQITLQPLEEKILRDFDKSKVVVCTDAGLSSTANRKFNDHTDRAFITSQSLKALAAPKQEWALASQGWLCMNEQGNKRYSLEEIREENDPTKLYFKEGWLTEGHLKQRFIVSYSLKYQAYQREIRNRQVERAQKMMDAGGKIRKAVNGNDPKRFINETASTSEGEIAHQFSYTLNQEKIKKEEKFDGFYAVATNLEGDAKAIVALNQRRWEIEESFRIMKSEFKSRPVFLQREDRIRAHFLTCFMALTLFRLLEKQLGERFSCSKIIKTLREFELLEIEGEGYVPLYERTALTDLLHASSGLKMDTKIVTQKKMKKNIRISKGKKSTPF